MRLRMSRATTAALATLSLFPAVAAADTFTVDPADDNDACARGTDTRCKTISQAVAAALAKDTIEVKEGKYADVVSVPAEKSELTIKATGAVDKTILTGTGTGDTLTIAAPKTLVSGLSVSSPENGQSAIVVAGAGVTLRDILAGRATTTVNAPTIEVASGPTALESVVAFQDAGPGTSQAITAGGDGIAISDSFIGSTRGDAVAISTSEANTIKRSQILATGEGSWAVEISSAATNTAAKKLVLDSSILSGGPNSGGGLLAVTHNPTAAGFSNAGPIAVEGRHLTVAGGASGVALDAIAGGMLLTGPVGAITGKFTSSILHGKNRAQHHVPQLLSAANTSTFSCTTCDGEKPTGNGTITWADGTPNTDDAKLFTEPAKRQFFLRADAPVIDKGADPEPGESDKDVNGSPRKNGAKTDIGADEFVNRPPVAAFGITAATVGENQPVGFVSGATDPEGPYGGGIVEWRWDFGDGQTQTTNVGGVAHTYSKRGTYNATLTVVDRQGAVSQAAAPKTITVRDGTPPAIAITKPTAGASLKLSAAKPKCRTTKPKKGSKAKPKRTCTKPKPKKLTVAGTAADESGLAAVEVALRIVSRKGSTATGTTCEFHTGLRIVTRPCDKPVFRKASISGRNWSWKSRTRKGLPVGRYEVLARATDTQGVASTALTAAAKTRIAFRIR